MRNYVKCKLLKLTSAVGSQYFLAGSDEDAQYFIDGWKTLFGQTPTVAVYTVVYVKMTKELIVDVLNYPNFPRSLAGMRNFTTVASYVGHNVCENLHGLVLQIDYTPFDDHVVLKSPRKKGRHG